jgi:hypothetical protein
MLNPNQSEGTKQMQSLSAKTAATEARKLTKATGQKHVVRPYAVGNKTAYAIVNVERFNA